ncbi:hypothetical protein CYMTET_13185 [Cymbomonas tetramitiformis]|uniref:PHD-type domain-containing protein n=1 Tax=Cymbomonas tetramitiformis TaxID=36881 RepID=A0AAE0GIN2_9CHLO|nr:hypothetical protein CYMTET_13185 [Cymbomonas tetramitiformis]
MAGSNIAIAQHRQTERYAQVRSGKYLPNFKICDFVFLKRSVNHGLQLHTREPILQIAELHEDGIALLRGRCGSTCKMHGSQIAVCHLTDIDPTLTYNLDDNEDARCQVCQKANRPASILLCDDCNQGYHLSCLQPKLTRVPKEEFWYCPKCVGQRPDTDLTPEYLHAYENRGKQLDGRRMLKVINGQPYEGTLTWLGVGERPFALKCKYDDGDEETFTLAELQQYLLPDDATIPQKQAVAQAQVTRHTVESAALAAITHDGAANTCPSTPYASLPKEWDLRSRATMLRAANTLNNIMPGPWDPAHINKLALHVQQQYGSLRQAAQAPAAQLRVCHPMSNEDCKRISAQA